MDRRGAYVPPCSIEINSTAIDVPMTRARLGDTIAISLLRPSIVIADPRVWGATVGELRGKVRVIFEVSHSQSACFVHEPILPTDIDDLSRKLSYTWPSTGKSRPYAPAVQPGDIVTVLVPLSNEACSDRVLLKTASSVDL